MNKEQLWEAILGSLEIQLSKANYNTWFTNAYIVDKSVDSITLGVPSNFVKTWIYSKFHQEILKSLKTIEPSVKQVKYVVQTKKVIIESLFAEVPEEPRPSIKESKATPEQHLSNSSVFQRVMSVDTVSIKEITSAQGIIGLNPKYVFGSLIVGKNNELAHAAALSVSQNPGNLYNPLFIYGGVGLGKTHLMQAVGNKFLENHPNANILYITAEKFANDFIESIRNSSADAFKKTYRSADMLLIDDIQFISGKERTQEEFFHTFNDLRDNGKQIVMTSDRLPREIPSIEQRLISRFEWGMIADIQAPDLETRMAILRSKLLKKGVVLREDILFYIAENILSNVRELEGALNRLIVFQQMENKTLYLDHAKQLLAGMINAKRKTTTPKKIAQVVADFHNISMDDLIKQSRRKELVKPRQIAMYLMRKELEGSYPSIGEFFGGRDHTTVMHGVNKITLLVETDLKLKQDIDMIIDKLYNN